MGPLLAALATTSAVIVLARRARRLPALEVVGLPALVGAAAVAVLADHDGGPAVAALVEGAHGGIVLGGIVVVLFVALPLLALLLLFEHHLHVKRVLAAIAADNAKLTATLDRLADELVRLRTQHAPPAPPPPPPPARPRGDDEEHDDVDERRRRRRDEEAD